MNARASQSARQPAQASATQSEGLRETVDSIAIAFILAFVFRAFIVEAFVIPTGSMAATLSGAHGTMLCNNCGWEFAYGLADPSNAPRRSSVIDENSIAVCPNCRAANHPVEINDAKGNYESGDRILVLKWTFDVGVPALGPQRWNVVVFKDPADGKTNYIKRLAGLPGEVLEILDGDVYSVPVEEISGATRATLEEMRHVKYLLRTGETLEARRLDRRLHLRLGDALEELDTKLRIQRKTEQAQVDLWRVAYNHDYPPRDCGPDQPRWVADEQAHAWSVRRRTLRFDGGNVGWQEIRLVADIDSFCAYNALPSRRSMPPSIRRNHTPVSDMRVRYVIDYRGGDGAIRAKLTKRGHVFVGELQADGTVRLLHAGAEAPDRFETLDTARVAPLAPGRKVELSFHNLDYRIRLDIDRQSVLTTTEDQYAPDVADLRRRRIPPSLPPAISARHMDIELSHVVVESDVYYLTQIPGGSRPLDYKAWGTRNNPILLRDEEYFMLGDNSAQSKDSRLWDHVGPHLVGRGEAYQLGTVPGDQLIGRAFFVSWPSGLRTSLLPPLKDRGWIPNFGRMRWIR